MSRKYPATRDAICAGCGNPFISWHIKGGKYAQSCSKKCVFLARSQSYSTDLTTQQVDNIVAEYTAGASFRGLKAKYSIGSNRLIDILTSADIPIRDMYAAADVHYRKWFPAVERLSDLNPTTAYYAGFLMADGMVKQSRNSARLSLSLQLRDRYIVDGLATYLEVPAAVTVVENSIRKTGFTGQYALLVVTDHRFLDTMKPWGIVPHKTYNWLEPEVFKNGANKHLLSAFLRGWFDGDGSVNPATALTVTGHPDALIWYASALEQLSYIGTHSISTAKNNFAQTFRVGGSYQIQAVRSILWDDGAGPRLHRKWSSFSDTKRLFISGKAASVLGVSQPFLTDAAVKGLVPYSWDHSGTRRMYDPEEVAAALNLDLSKAHTHTATVLDVAHASNLTSDDVYMLAKLALISCSKYNGTRSNTVSRFDLSEATRVVQELLTVSPEELIAPSALVRKWGLENGHISIKINQSSISLWLLRAYTLAQRCNTAHSSNIL